MTGNKKLVKKGDAARSPTLARPSTASNARRAGSWSGTAAGTLKRVVTVPQQTDNSAAWSTFEQRQRKLRKARARTAKEQPVLVERTFRQTGMRATSGRIQALRRPLPYRASVPVRSGRKQSRRRRVWRVVWLLLILALALALLYLFLFSNVFRVRTVAVTGTQDPALRSTVAKMHIEGQNILLFDLSRVKEQLSALPLVADVTVQKQWPATLSINVVERKPALVWQSAQTSYLVDQSGMIMSEVNTQAQPEIAAMNTVIDQSAQPGSANNPKTEPQPRVGTYLQHIDIAFAVKVLQRLPVVTGINITKLYYDGTMYASTAKRPGGGDSRGTYIMENPEGWKAYLGGAQDANSLDNRLQELREVLNLAQSQHEQIATIDLRYGLRPVFTLQK